MYYATRMSLSAYYYAGSGRDYISLLTDTLGAMELRMLSISSFNLSTMDRPAEIQLHFASSKLYLAGPLRVSCHAPTLPERADEPQLLRRRLSVYHILRVVGEGDGEHSGCEGHVLHHVLAVLI